ncbi:uncharacterized protein LOC101737360 isoform X3 [Bombyx mori]|nr:uncharacterized protein LOC101737360 isoform X2 [Bombyx mori]
MYATDNHGSYCQRTHDIIKFPVKELLVMEILSTRKIQHLMGTDVVFALRTSKKYVHLTQAPIIHLYSTITALWICTIVYKEQNLLLYIMINVFISATLRTFTATNMKI